MSRIKFDDFVEATGKSPGGLRVHELAPPDATDIEAAVRRLPALPTLLQELLRELRDENADLQLLVERISSDPSLTTRVLKMANSPFYMRAQEVVDVGRAVMTLGFKTVSNLVVAACLRGSMTTAGAIPGYERNGIFRHSLASALCCARLGARLPSLRDVSGLLFVAGLLHDIGRVALAVFYQQRSDAFANRDEASLAPAIERELLGLDHQEAGRMVMERWGLPDELAHCITRHHDATAAIAGQPVTLAVALVDAFLNRQGFARTRRFEESARLVELCAALGTDEDRILAILGDFEDEMSALMGSFA